MFQETADLSSEHPAKDEDGTIDPGFPEGDALLDETHAEVIDPEPDQRGGDLHDTVTVGVRLDYAHDPDIRTHPGTDSLEIGPKRTEVDFRAGQAHPGSGIVITFSERCICVLFGLSFQKSD